MRIALFVLAVALVLGGLVGVLMARDPGYVLVVYQDLALETSLWLALALLLLAYLLAWGITALVARLSRGGGRLQGWNRRRRDRAAREQMLRGLLLMAEGRWPDARKLLESTASRVDAPLINYLNAARCAQEMGDSSGRDELLRAAHESTPGAKFAVGLTRAELQRDQRQWEQCLATLLQLQRDAPRHARVLRMLAECYRALEDWQAILELLGDLRKHGSLDDASLRELELRAWMGRIDQGREPPERVWKSVPKELRREPTLAAHGAGALAAGGAADAAEALLREALEHTWDADLVRAYGALTTADPGRQLVVAEGWLKSRPNDSELLLALGRIALMNRQWARAREYLEASLRSRRSAEAQGELGRLCVALGESERGAELLLEALQADLPALPQPQAADQRRGA
ncbi:MAG: heme biosynthesis HemY N-terminal domain-containing protein [Pseudomonadales bacterium]